MCSDSIRACRAFEPTTCMSSEKTACVCSTSSAHQRLAPPFSSLPSASGFQQADGHDLQARAREEAGSLRRGSSKLLDGVPVEGQANGAQGGRETGTTPDIGGRTFTPSQGYLKEVQDPGPPEELPPQVRRELDDPEALQFRRGAHHEVLPAESERSSGLRQVRLQHLPPTLQGASEKTAIESDSPHWRLVRLAGWLGNVQEAELLVTKEEKSPKKEKTSRGSHPLRLRTTPAGSQESARDKDGPGTEKEEKLYQQVSEMQEALKNALEQIATLNQEKQFLEHEARNQQGIHKSRRET